MVERQPAEELKGLRDLLSRLESGELRMLSRNGEDVTQSEIDTLKRNISFVDAVLAWRKSKAEGVTGPKGPG